MCLRNTSFRLEVGDLSKVNSQSAFVAFCSTLDECKSWPDEMTSFARIEATCGLMLELSESGLIRIIPSPRDENGIASIRLHCTTKTPLSYFFNERCFI